MISVETIDDRYYVRFTGKKNKFTDYQKAVFAVKDKKWDSEKKSWYFTKTGLQMLKVALGDDCPDVLTVPIINQKKIPKDYTDVGSTMKLPPFPFQQEVMAFMKEVTNALVVLPCGAGKTPIGIGGYIETVIRRDIEGAGLIVVKASLKTQWYKEVQKFSNLKSVVVRTSKDVEGKHWDKIARREKKLLRLEDPAEIDNVKQQIAEIEEQIRSEFYGQFQGYDLYICNYETLNDPIVRRELHKLNIKYAYVDEIHYIKNAETQRSKSLQEFADIPNRYGATATPVQKDSEDIFGIYKFLKPDLFPSLSKFQSKYVKYIRKYGRNEKVGSKNLLELNREISPYMIVKPEDEVSQYLPKLFPIPRYCDLEPVQEEMTQRLLEEVEELKEKKAKRRGNIPESQVKTDPLLLELEAQIMARQTFAQELCNSEKLLAMSDSKMAKNYLTGSKDNKLELCLDLVEEIIDSGQKVCIFSRFERMQTVLTEAINKRKSFKGYKIAYVNGTMDSDKRYREYEERFQQQDEYKVLLMSDAGAEGINLSKIKYVIEYDLADGYGKQTQRHGRIKRADSIHKTVYVYQLIANNSWDEIQLKIVGKKEKYDSGIVRGVDVEGDES